MGIQYQAVDRSPDPQLTARVQINFTTLQLWAKPLTFRCFNFLFLKKVQPWGYYGVIVTIQHDVTY